MIFVCIAALLAGMFASLMIPLVIPQEFLMYAGVTVLYLAAAAAEAVRRMLAKNNNLKIFISGFFCGLIFVLLFIIAGQKLDLNIYPVCMLVITVALIKSCYGIFKHYTGENN